MFKVAPFAGAWIEIQREREARTRLRQLSLRSPERGLKYKYDGLPVWSEESLRSPERGLKYKFSLTHASLKPSLRSPERGLK